MESNSTLRFGFKAVINGFSYTKQWNLFFAFLKHRNHVGNLNPNVMLLWSYFSRDAYLRWYVKPYN